MNSLRIEKVAFERISADGVRTNVTEYGIIINEGNGPIIDMNGLVVKNVWTWSKTYDLVVTVTDDGHRYEGKQLR